SPHSPSHTLSIPPTSPLLLSPLTPLSPSYYFFFLMIRRPPTPTLFPYTTLFRSEHRNHQSRPGDSDCHRTRRQAVPIHSDAGARSEEHTSELQSLTNLVCRLLLEKKKKNKRQLRESYSTHRIDQPADQRLHHSAS